MLILVKQVVCVSVGRLSLAGVLVHDISGTPSGVSIGVSRLSSVLIGTEVVSGYVKLGSSK